MKRKQKQPKVHRIGTVHGVPVYIGMPEIRYIGPGLQFGVGTRLIEVTACADEKRRFVEA